MRRSFTKIFGGQNGHVLPVMVVGLAAVIAASGFAVYQYDSHKVPTSSAICSQFGPYTYYYDQNHRATEPYVLNNDRYGNGTQCPVHTDGGNTPVSFTVEGGGAANGGVEAYPDFIRGCSFTKCYSPTWPKLVSSLPAWHASSHFSASGVTGKWNANYDLWFNRNYFNPPGASNGAEILINFGRSYSEPQTNYKASVVLGGSTYDVFEYPRTQYILGANHTWNYIQYWRINATYSVNNLNLNQFMQDAANRGFMSRSWYWTGIDSGFEIWDHGAGLKWDSDLINSD